jgi:hypothetical protein
MGQSDRLVENMLWRGTINKREFGQVLSDCYPFNQGSTSMRSLARGTSLSSSGLHKPSYLR